MGRTYFLAGCCLAASSATAFPQYTASNFGPLGPFNFQRVSVSSFTANSRITGFAPSFAFLFHVGNLTNLDKYPKFQRGGTIHTNDRSQFCDTAFESAARFKSNIDAPWQTLHPIGEYAERVYARGMTNNYVFGAQLVSAVLSSFAEPWTYNTTTGEYAAFSPVPYGYPSAEIQDMNESGSMLVRMSVNLFGEVDRLNGNMSIFRNGVQIANLGNMLFGSMNSKGQAVGESFDLVTGVYSATFWDGTKLQVIDPDLNVSGYTPVGLSDDGTIVSMYGGEDRFSTIYKGGKYYSFAEVCPGLPAGMKIYGAKIRPDGAIAGVGVLGNETYLMRFDPVPEPASLLVVGGGLCALVSRRRLRPGS